jgi:hypothetical protein
MFALLAYDPATNPLNNNEWSFPLAECIHIASFALSIGTIAVVDMRLLGIGLRHQSAAQLTRDTGLWTMAGLITVILSGLAIFSSDPRHYYYNESFRFKVTVLLIGILYNYTIHRKVALTNPGPVVGAMVGGVSILLWLAVVAGGLFIAFV